MTTPAQDEIDMLKSEVLSMVSGPALQKLENGIKARSTMSLGGQKRFLENVRNAFEQAEVAEFLPEVARSNSDGGPRKAASTNPWSRIGWNVSEQGRIAKTLGAEKAASMAKSAGCVLGSTKPNPDFN